MRHRKLKAHSSHDKRTAVRLQIAKKDNQHSHTTSEMKCCTITRSDPPRHLDQEAQLSADSDFCFAVQILRALPGELPPHCFH